MVASDSWRHQRAVVGREGVGLEDGWSFQEASLQGEETSFQALFRLSPQLVHLQPIRMSGVTGEVPSLLVQCTVSIE